MHGELLTLGIKVAVSTVWEILRGAGIDPCPDRTTATWAKLLRSQAQALLAADFIETVTLTGTRMYILAGHHRLQRRGAQRSVQRAAGIDDHPGGELAAVGQPHDVDAEAAAHRPALAA